MLLCAVQALLLLAHPVMILGWLAFGAWHGLRQQAFESPLSLLLREATWNVFSARSNA